MRLEAEDIALSAVNWVFWLFQITMTVFLFKKIVSKDTSFSALFYTLFVIISVVDSMYFLIVSHRRTKEVFY